MSNSEKLICGDCKSTFIVENGKRGSNIISILLWSTFIIPGIMYSIWRKRKPQKNCTYCGSNFIMPFSYEAEKMLSPKKQGE